MISDELKNVREYEREAEGFIGDDRPAFHLTARTGWMNDPNGFSIYEGKYHLFYQYYPYVSKWGPMHWGHAVSTDLLHWEYLPAALAPDTPADEGGCFSGSALTLPDGRQLLMYTGVQAMETVEGKRVARQMQCIAIGDGQDYVKWEGNPVIDHSQLPEGSSPYDFRDPKVWQEDDGTYVCLVGVRPADGSGELELYESQDALHWRFRQTLARNRNWIGKMWECPDYFSLDGKKVLLVSPQDMMPSGYEYHNGNGTLCLIGDYDEVKGEFVPEHDQSVDYGIDFYAMQTVKAQDGRRIMIGWMQNWDTLGIYTDTKRWFGQMSLPRELSIREGRLFQSPIRELEGFRENRVCHEDVSFEGVLELPGVKGRVLDLTLEVAPQEGLYKKFSVVFAQNEQYHTSLSYRPDESILKVDRKYSGSRRAVIHQRRAKVRPREGRIKLRLILDWYSVEVFINDGEQVMTATLYTDRQAEGISFHAEGRVRMSVTKYDLCL